MKNLLQNFYIFSKLSLSVSLLFIILLFGYLFYKSYHSLTLKEDKATNNNKNLINSINLNSSKIEKIELLLSENNLKLNKIFDSLDKNNENSKSNLILKEIQNDFKNIKTELKKLQSDLIQNKTVKDLSTQTSINNINIENALELIIFKFENGQDYSKELELLSKLLGSNKNHIAEKLYLINSNRFVGLDLLFLNFKKETDHYISNNLVKKNKLINIILPYIKIEPSKTKKLSDRRLVIIDNALKQIENKKYTEAIDSIKLIDENKKFFSTTIGQLSIAIDFKNTIEDIIGND